LFCDISDQKYAISLDTLEGMVSQLEQKISDGYNGVLKNLENL